MFRIKSDDQSTNIVFYVLLKIIFKKKQSCSCKNYTKRFYLCDKKEIHFKIIWFYLVRAEVVLWWHCLIFFARVQNRVLFAGVRSGNTPPMVSRRKVGKNQVFGSGRMAWRMLGVFVRRQQSGIFCRFLIFLKEYCRAT